jgi:hypothetical protein
MRRIDLEAVAERMNHIKDQMECLEQKHGDQAHYSQADCPEEIARVVQASVELSHALSLLRVPRFQGTPGTPV